MPDDNQTMFLRTREDDEWINWHETVKGPIARVDVISRPSDDLSYSRSAVKRCTAQIQRSIREARDDGLECRAVGRGWSLSDAPLTTGTMIDISRLNLMRKVHHMQVDPAYSGGSARRRTLVMAQAGTYVSELNRWLEAPEQRLSVRTTGAANGQTLAGATQTGTHGSVLGRGAMHDQVVGLHIVTGPDSEVWLERASYPVIRESVANAYGAPLVRNDDLFNAAVMGLGGFGVIHNMVMETRKRFMMSAFNTNKDRNNQTLQLDADMRHRIASLDFSTEGRLDPADRSGTPYFYQPIINPNTPAPHGVLLTHMYEELWDEDHEIDYTLKEDKCTTSSAWPDGCSMPHNSWCQSFPVWWNRACSMSVRISVPGVSCSDTRHNAPWSPVAPSQSTSPMRSPQSMRSSNSMMRSVRRRWSMAAAMSKNRTRSSPSIAGIRPLLSALMAWPTTIPPNFSMPCLPR